MAPYIVSRVLQMIPAVILLSMLVFLALYLIPGDPAGALLGGDATLEAIQALRRKWGLDEPLPIRYARWVGNVLKGDLGESVLSRRSVMDLARAAFPVTLELASAGLTVALLIAVPAAILSSQRPGSLADLAIQALAYVGLSTPTFWLGLLFIWSFAVHLRWLPTSGFVNMAQDPVGNLKSIALPALTLGIFLSTQLMRYLRAGIIDTMHEAYVQTARSKGLREPTIMTRHVIRNALIPFVTVLGIQVGHLLGGTVVIEEVFGIPGMGRVALRALLERDYQVVTGMVLLLAVLFLVVNLVVDILYVVLDPRIRHEGPVTLGN